MIILWVFVGIICWVVGMGITARLWDKYDEEDGVLLFLMWWVMLPYIILINLFEMVRGRNEV